MADGSSPPAHPIPTLTRRFDADSAASVLDAVARWVATHPDVDVTALRYEHQVRYARHRISVLYRPCDADDQEQAR
ncbi:hypothetical protein [Polymorphospora lycopeni]|uniref:Uncharacterized protein n=1 Tax=Polymorphospora lycopeni TaxID=3140240 RepID=A0ABV5CWU4_9ACTN